MVGYTFGGIGASSSVATADVLDEDGDWQSTYATWTAGSTNVWLYVKWVKN
jgi:hypothetical protein